MAAGNVADTICHADNRQTECKCGQDIAAAVCRVTSDEHSSAASDQDKGECADEFCDVLFHEVHPFLKMAVVCIAETLPQPQHAAGTVPANIILLSSIDIVIITPILCTIL